MLEKPEAWGAKAGAILLDLQCRRLPEGAELAHATGQEPHVLLCDCRSSTFEWRSRLSQVEIDRAPKAPAVTQGDCHHVRPGRRRQRRHVPPHRQGVGRPTRIHIRGCCVVTE